MQLKVTVNGVAYDVEVEVEEEPAPALGAIFMAGGSFAPPSATGPAAGDGASTAAGSGVHAPLAGTVAQILVEEGQAIEAGEVVAVLEAMKMETEISAPESGVVTSVLVEPGDAVSGGQLLVELA